MGPSVGCDSARGGGGRGRARGHLQLRGRRRGRRYGVSDAFDPEQNITAGAHYLRDLMARFGNDMELALAAYNAGEDAVERYGRSIPPFSETRHYVPAVMRVYHKLLSQQRSG
ncbi:MAG: lytic transglycosylase domain-containing protein [Gammaproteobacteria bacterium]|nr:MAG: lytic transglycosylase domain-containing protein [Gammaproteobacteria bacterium]